MPCFKAVWIILGALMCRLAHAALTNHTIDDTSPAVVYTQPPLIQCMPTTCDEPWTKRLFNGTSAITNSPIIVSFTGTAVYVYLGIAGSCIFNLDGIEAGLWNDTIQGDDQIISQAYWNAGLPDVKHTLTIYPATPESFVQFDYLIYSSSSSRKLRVRAIIGGVVGGVAFGAALSIVAFLVHRRERKRRLSMRGIPLGDHWPDKPSIKLVQMPAQK